MLDAHSSAFHEARIATAGAYVLLDGYYPFVVGPKHTGDTLAVVRLGGHCEAGESAWRCAAREIYEEANLQVHPLPPPATYWLDGAQADADIRIRRGAWPADSANNPAPLFVASYQQAQGRQLSVMYLAHATGHPKPSAEVRGLLLLRPHDIHTIVQRPITLGQYLRAGGQAVLQDRLDEDRLLEPFLQLQALSRMLRIHQNVLIVR
jgi:8-oxo-dGTP pyrophosphatase MutT (NUDIX family)